MAETTMAELFARDPLKLTKDDIQLIVKKMREERGRFKSDKKLPPQAPKLTDGQKAAKSLGIELDLGDLT